MDANAVVLVEGESDQVALQTLARRLGRDLDAEGIAIVPMGGAKNIGHFLERFRGSVVAGMCDAGEAGGFHRALQRAGMDGVAVYVCDTDLEDELIHALGVDGVERVIAAEGELASLRTLQQMPAQRGRTVHQHLRRFIGSRSGRKLRYARAFVEALDLDALPRPLEAVLAQLPQEQLIDLPDDLGKQFPI